MFAKGSRWWAWLALWLPVLLAACASPPGIESSPDDAFNRTGRFAVMVTEAGADPQSIQGGFAWLDTGRRQQLDLANPLGSILARVLITPDGAVLTRSDGSTQVGANANALLAQVVGTNIPVQGLTRWLQGRLTGTNAVNVKRDNQARPASFEASGWSVKLSRYDAQGPRLLALERRDGVRHVRVRLVVDAG